MNSYNDRVMDEQQASIDRLETELKKAQTVLFQAGEAAGEQGKRIKELENQLRGHHAQGYQEGWDACGEAILKKMHELMGLGV